MAKQTPRLIQAMRYTALLGETEARACIRDFRNGHAYSGEAVNHFGGTRAVIVAAIQARRRARRYFNRLMEV